MCYLEDRKPPRLQSQLVLKLSLKSSAWSTLNSTPWHSCRSQIRAYIEIDPRAAPTKTLDFATIEKMYV